MIACRYCTHSEYLDPEHIYCHRHRSAQDPYGLCPHFEKEPGTDDDLRETPDPE